LAQRALQHRLGLAHNAPSSRNGPRENSIARTWALIIAASVFYIPVLTIMQLEAGQPSTILGGFEELVSSRMYPLAALMFFASTLVPCSSSSGSRSC
jgi:uncharacterized paraquat-inducible protein A